MQLVVKISEDTFFNLKKKQNRTEVDNAVLNGTPLPKQDKFDNQAKWLLNGLKIQINALADEKGNQLDLEDVIKIIDAYKEQKDNGFFDEIMNDESEDEETYEKIKEIIEKVKEQEE